MGRGGWLYCLGATQLEVPPAGAALVATLENVLLAFEPRAVMAAMQTTMIRASMTAYSTAVGPSSFLRKLTRLLVAYFIRFSFGVGCPGCWAVRRSRGPRGGRRRHVYLVHSD